MQHFWKRAGIMAGLVAASLSLSAGPAPAQFMQLFGFPSAEPPPPLPPDVVAGRLTRMGFKVVRLRRSPQGYLAEATDLAGRSFRLLVDPVDGSVLQHVALPGPSLERDPRDAREPREPRRGATEAAPPTERHRSRPGPQSPQQSAQQSPAQPKPAPEAAAPAPSEPEPKQAAPAPAKPAAPFVPKSGPGFANGVPINPLD